MNPFDSIVWDRDGGAIESESFRRIDAEADPRMRGRFSDAEWRVARRLGEGGIMGRYFIYDLLSPLWAAALWVMLLRRDDRVWR